MMTRVKSLLVILTYTLSWCWHLLVEFFHWVEIFLILCMISDVGLKPR